MRSHRSAFFFVALPAVLPIAAFGQAAPPPALRTGASLVLVDVVVTEHDKPVLNLAGSRFHIFEDGKEQAVSSFDQHQPPSAPPAWLAPAALPANTFTNASQYPPSSAVNILLLDGLNTSFGNQMQVRRKMIEYLGSLKPGTPMAVFTLGTKLQLVTQFTNDPAALLALFKNSKTNPQQSPPLQSALPESQLPIAQQPGMAQGLQAAPIDSLSNSSAFVAGPLSAVQALQQFQADSSAFQIATRVHITLGAMEQLASYLGGIPGRKNVIWFSSSFPIELLPDASASFPFGNLSAYREEMQKATDMLAAARVALYPIDANGLWSNNGFSADIGFNPPSTARTPAQNSQWASQRESQYAEEATMQQVADDTGGKAFLETNNFDKAFAGAVENGATYYTLAYVPKSNGADGKFHKIEVRLDNDRGLKLSYRRGYYADAPASGPAAADAATSVFATALAHDAPQATAILFKVRVLPASDPAFQNVTLPLPEPSVKAASFKDSGRRYIVDLTLDPHGVAFDIAPDGTRKAAIELAIIAYDDAGERLNYWIHAFQVGLDPAKLQHIMDTGITVRLPFDVPPGNVDLRIGVHDMNADRAGSLEVPLQVPTQ